MRDADVRLELAAVLEAEHAAERDETRFVPELGLCGEVRVDLAVVNGNLTGYEIKSARDTLRRLPGQVATYSRVLDFAVLVVADNHVEHARELVRPWWGLTVASVRDGGGVDLTVQRPPRRNAAVDPFALAQLLWRDEALAELTCRGLDRGIRSKPRQQIWARLAEELSLSDLRDVVRRRLKDRLAWRDGAAAPR